uniref:Reverse transcriptase domain-containing protein n=1 Tax=Cannabis sativa TaxID=3483 RepID=A0A803PQY8_CANSA
MLSNYNTKRRSTRASSYPRIHQRRSTRASPSSRVELSNVATGLGLENGGGKFSIGRGGGPYQAPSLPMRVLSWNCRGLARPPAMQALVAWVRRYKVDCVFLMETKLGADQMETTCRAPNFDFGEFIPSCGRSGGFGLLWNIQAGITSVAKLHSGFECKVWDPDEALFWSLFAIYGTPYDDEKLVFWENLSSRINQILDPWALVGDLNVIAAKEVDSGCSKDEDEVEKEIVDLWEKWELVWRQRSREIWLSHGNRNSKFLQSSTLVRRKRNFIWSLKDDHGSLVFREREKGDILIKYFKSLFTSSDPCIPQDLQGLISGEITASENEVLMSIPTHEEITHHVFQMHPLKSPGPDGFSRCFFRKCWNSIGPEITSCIQTIFRSGSLPPLLNHTFICLIPKCENPDSVDKFQPIALCNFVYKVVTRIIAHRLRPLLDRLVSPLQSAFVPGRWIAESSLLTQELVHTIKSKKGKGGLMAIKIDMNKAYDRLEWKFIEKVLQVFGFHSHFITLIMKCITTISYSILLNGRPLKKFLPQRGIRQGDPMSPFLFILCNEVFSRLIARDQSLGKVNGIRIARNAPAISHLMFADDTILFYRANVEEAESLQNCMETYGSWSGQQCSKHKSGILFSGSCTNDSRRQIMEKLGVGLVKGNEKHLGNPFLFSRSKRKDFQFLKTNLCNRLEGWRMKTLSTIGRMVTIKSVAMAMPLYTMSSCKIPITSCQELDDIVRKFWCKGNLDSSWFLATKTWDVLCQPKGCGGLGFRRFSDMNNAFATLVWKGILEARKLICEGACTMLANGEDTNIWWQPWIPWLDYSKFREIIEIAWAKASSLCRVADLMFRRSRTWDRGFLNFVFGSEMGDRISSIQINAYAEKDLIIWKDSEVGAFSSMMLWRAVAGALPTSDKYGKTHTNDCLFCSSDNESPLHIFVRCPMAKALCFGGPFPLRSELTPGATLSEVICSILPLLEGSLKLPFLIWMTSAFETIWLWRNRIRYGRIMKISVDEMLNNALNRFVEMSDIHKPSSEQMLTISNSLPVSGVVSKVILADGSFKDGNFGATIVAIDDVNKQWLIRTIAGRLDCSIAAELKAVHLALLWAKEKQWEDMCIFSDSQVVVKSLLKGISPSWKCWTLFSSVLELKNSLVNCSCAFVSCDVISFVDLLAKDAEPLNCQGEGFPLWIP